HTRAPSPTAGSAASMTACFLSSTPRPPISTLSLHDALPICRFIADIREIWFMQSRFERVNARAIWRMLEQPRFRAAVDFLQLRAEAHEVDSVMAQWWMDLANAAPEDRIPMVEAYQAAQRGERPASAVKKRRRRRPRRKPGSSGENIPQPSNE